MNKSKVPMLGVAAFMEFLLFICTLKLADYNIYIWIVAAVLVVAFGMTIFRLITEVMIASEMLQEKLATSYKEDMEGMFQQIKENNKEQNDKIADIFEQQKTICADAIDRLVELESKNIQELEKSYRNCLEENSARSASQYEELLNATYVKFVKSIEEQTEAFSGKVDHMNKAYGDILTEGHKKMDKQIEKFVKEISETDKKLLSENAKEYKEMVQDSSAEMYSKCESLMNGMIEQHHDVMNQFKQEFVNANVEALANVEKENLDIITQAHQDISELKEAIQKTDSKHGETTQNMISLLGEIEKCIAKGLDTQSEQFEGFSDDFEEDIKNLSKAIKQQFQKYMDTIEGYKEDTKQISEGIESATKEYRNLFDEVRKNQQEMNDLTKEDINLLNKLMKK